MQVFAAHRPHQSAPLGAFSGSATSWAALLFPPQTRALPGRNSPPRFPLPCPVPGHARSSRDGERVMAPAWRESPGGPETPPMGWDMLGQLRLRVPRELKPPLERAEGLAQSALSRRGDGRGDVVPVPLSVPGLAGMSSAALSQALASAALGPRGRGAPLTVPFPALGRGAAWRQRGQAAQRHPASVGGGGEDPPLLSAAAPAKPRRGDAGAAPRLLPPKPPFLPLPPGIKFLPPYPGESRGTRTRVFSQLLYRRKQRKLPTLEPGLLPS